MSWEKFGKIDIVDPRRKGENFKASPIGASKLLKLSSLEAHRADEHENFQGRVLYIGSVTREKLRGWLTLSIWGTFWKISVHIFDDCVKKLTQQRRIKDDSVILGIFHVINTLGLRRISVFDYTVTSITLKGHFIY